MFTSPIFSQLESNSKNILLLGMGGGYDVFTGIPLYFELKERKKPDGTPMFGNLVLGNLSFTKDVMKMPIGKQISPVCLEARYKDYIDRGQPFAFDESLKYPNNYFAEFHLSKWFYNIHKADVPVYTFSLYDLGVAQYTTAIKELVKIYHLDTIFLVDAGVDSVLKNNEEGMGTYSEDLLSICAVKNVDTVQYKYLTCVGLGTEGGISCYDFLENWSALTKLGGYLGSVGWAPQMNSVKQYLDAMSKSVPTNSSINGQIVCAVEGEYGHHCPDYLRARGLTKHDLFINPLMSMSWFFDLGIVCRYRLFIGTLEAATSRTNLETRMTEARTKAGIEVSSKYKGPRHTIEMFPPQ